MLQNESTIRWCINYVFFDFPINPAERLIQSGRHLFGLKSNQSTLDHFYTLIWSYALRWVRTWWPNRATDSPYLCAHIVCGLRIEFACTHSACIKCKFNLPAPHRRRSRRSLAACIINGNTINYTLVVCVCNVCNAWATAMNQSI